jgi:endonuclease/exonuclease/phosphatase family metal-dependent hydrolase
MLMQTLVAGAQQSIFINTPYFLPDASLIDELIRAKLRGVTVKIITPGKHSDHLLTRSSSQHCYGRLLKAGVHLFEYQPAMIHAKILIVDGIWSVVGSTNFDNRSFGLNDEVNMAVFDDGFATRLAEDFARDLAESRAISYDEWAHRPLLVRPDRIASVLRELDADVIALQEVIADSQSEAESDQPQFIAEALGGYEVCFGEARQHRGAPYGNAVLSRLPVLKAQSYDLTRQGRERRGCLRVDVRCGATNLHVLNVHLGTSFFERRHQGRKLISTDVLGSKELKHPTIVVGDFNEWTRGLATRLMSTDFSSVEARLHLKRRRTYPGVLPLFHLDHFYFDERLELVSAKLVRTKLALVASDHLPIMAEFRVG